MSAPEETALLTSDEPFALRMRPRLRAPRDVPPVRRVTTPHGDPAWMVAGHGQIRQLLRDERLGRSHPAPDDKPEYAGHPAYDHAISREHATADAMHSGLRRMLVPHFTARRMTRLRPRIEALVEDALDRMVAAGPPAELYGDLAEPLVLKAIGELLGVPEEDRPLCSDLMSHMEIVTDETGEKSADTLYDYFLRLAVRRRADPEPGEDTVAQLCAAGATDSEAAQLAQLLMFAGVGSTVKQIGYGFLLLACNPEQRDALVERPALLPGAVEEMLRISGSPSLPRWAREDIAIAGVTIRRDELVLLDLTFANMDDGTFPEAADFDIARSPNRHLSFSHGVWTCIGAPLARTVLQSVFGTLLARLPTVRLTVPVEELETVSEPLCGGLAERLPVTW